MKTENEKPALSEKDLEIIAVGASVAAGCLPCTRFHLRAAARTGADQAEITQAVRDATRLRMAATAIMARAGGLSETESLPDPDPNPSLLRELVAIGAAYAINCTTSLKAHLTAARDLGASDRQTFAAMEMACRIKDMAGTKAKTAAGEFLGMTEEPTGPCCGEPDAATDRSASCGPDGRSATGETCSCHAEGQGRKPSETNPKEV